MYVKFGVNFDDPNDLTFLENQKSIYVRKGWEILDGGQAGVFFITQDGSRIEGWDRKGGRFISAPANLGFAVQSA